MGLMLNNENLFIRVQTSKTSPANRMRHILDDKFYYSLYPFKKLIATITVIITFSTTC